MPMTMTQKILADRAGLESVKAGDLIQAQVDLVLANDITAPVAFQAFDAIGAKKVFDPAKIALVPDHFVPNKDIKSAEQSKIMRTFAREQKIINYFEVGRMGIEHVLIPELGLVVPGDVVIGADSHTCTYGALGAFATGVGSTDAGAAMATGRCWFRVPPARLFKLEGRPGPFIGGKDVILYILGIIKVDGARYKSMEFTGDGIRHLSLDSRLTMTNMAIEGGAKNGIFPVDDSTKEYIRARTNRDFQAFQADSSAPYEHVLEVDMDKLTPQVACPSLPDKVRPAAELGSTTIDQVVIGSCTNGRMEDLRTAAAILKGHKTSDRIRTIVIPGTQEIYLQAMQEGLIRIFIESGAAVSTPTCGPCLGGHMGILAEGERALATTNRNFVGRMGHPGSEVFLSGPAVAAASALTGRITCPVNG